MTDVTKALALAQVLVDRVALDDSGRIVGQQYQGGNGGLLSRETLFAADALRRELASLRGPLPDDADTDRALRDHARDQQL